jgi:CRP/FNR family transcriptional regulator, dissimilatory nitrate respiration regulator
MKFDAYQSDLPAVALFRGIAPEDLRALMTCFSPAVRSVQKGEIAVAAGDPLRGIGIVLKGAVEIAHESAAGGKSLLAQAEQGSTFGEIAAFAGRETWPSTVTARADSLLMFVPPERFLGNCPKACGFHRTLVQNMLRIMADKALRLNRKVEYLELKGIRAKLCTYLLEQRKLNGSDTFVLPMNKSDLADYLHVSRPSMSRELGLLRDEGALDYYRSGIRLLDVEAIRKAASS